MFNCICRICANLLDAGLGTMTRGCPFCHRMHLINLTEGGIGYLTTSYKDINNSKPRYVIKILEH